MTLFVISHPDKADTIVEANTMEVDDGHLLGKSGYSGSPETTSAFAPGTWVNFKPVEKCPSCGRQIGSRF